MEISEEAPTEFVISKGGRKRPDEDNIAEVRNAVNVDRKSV
mgnify:CR=1 FL=1